MFTGIVERVGRVAFHRSAPGGALRLRVDGVQGWQLSLGESLSVDGVCLTVVRTGGGWFESDCSPETLAVTTVGDMRTGSRVNLERALPADGRLGGHFVQGHVDGTGEVVEVRRVAQGRVVRFCPPKGAAPFLVPRGSVAVNGVSLTITAHAEARFEVHLIPHTLEVTNLGDLRPGRSVNIEADILGKYVRAFLGGSAGQSAG